MFLKFVSFIFVLSHQFLSRRELWGELWGTFFGQQVVGDEKWPTTTDCGGKVVGDFFWKFFTEFLRVVGDFFDELWQLVGVKKTTNR